jgi:sulfide:quinone oxidoreductase
MAIKGEIMAAKIVRLTDQLSVASQIGLDDIPRIAAEGFRVIVNNRPDQEEPGQLAFADAARATEAAGLQYRYQPVMAATLTPAAIDEFDRLVAEADGPVLAHCRSGTRCYLLWAATELKKGRASAESLIREAAAKGFDISSLTRFT